MELQILISKYNSLKENSPRFSQRALAAQVGISPGYLSKVMSGQKNPSIQVMERLAKALKVDDLSRFSNEKSKQFEILNDDSLWLFEKWYHVAVLDALTLDQPKINADFLSKALGLSKSITVDVLRELVRRGFVRLGPNGSFQKVEKKIRLPTLRSIDTIRRFHQQMLLKAIDLMERKVTQADFEKRLVAGVTVASNSEQIEKARAFLHEALYKTVEILMEGDSADTLYQVNVVMTPLIDESSKGSHF